MGGSVEEAKKITADDARQLLVGRKIKRVRPVRPNTSFGCSVCLLVTEDNWIFQLAATPHHAAISYIRGADGQEFQPEDDPIYASQAVRELRNRDAAV
jgi:hypothetical protein